MGGLGVNVLGVVLAGTGAVVRFTPLPAEVAALVTAAEAQPRVRGTLEAVFGRVHRCRDGGAQRGRQSLAGGWLGLSVDAAQRISALRETRAVAAGWQDREIELLGDPQHAAAEPVVVERPRPLPPGPVESYAERAALLGLGAAGMALPATGNPRRAAALALTATPKAARVARAGSPRHPGPDITTRAATTATGTSAGRLVGRLTGRAKRARTVALVGAQLGRPWLSAAPARPCWPAAPAPPVCSPGSSRHPA